MMPEEFLEKRKNNSDLLKYKIISIASLFLMIFFLFKAYSKDNSGSSLKDININSACILEIEIDGEISPDKYDVSKIEALEKNEHVKAIILNVDSPGGSASESEKIYNAIRKVGTLKPIVTIIESMACSGGYMIALAGDQIFSSNTSIVGSIGVLIPSFEFTELMQKFGINYKTYRSGKVKAMPNPFEKASPEAEEELMSNLQDIHMFFKEMVAQRRNLDSEKVAIMSEGQVFTGRQAKTLGLIDSIALSRASVKEWLVEKKNIDEKLEIKKYDILLNKSKKEFDSIDFIRNASSLITELKRFF